MTKRSPKRQELEKQLPWYAARTLSRCEADLVERALAADAELARCYDLVRQELADTIHLNETLGAPSARVLEKLFAAIEAEEMRAPSRRRISRTPARLRSAYNASPSRLAARAASRPTATRGD
jgi:hypothetical protein